MYIHGRILITVLIAHAQSYSAMAHKVAVKSGRDREPPVATTSNSERQKGAASTVHEVGEVSVYIPPELSAAGVELKILGSVRVINKVRYDS